MQPPVQSFFASIAVLCNNPKKYAVVEPEGRISAQKCCDIVVRHIAVSPAAVSQTDKFRIHIFEEGCPDVAGKRDVLATLHPGAYRGAQEWHAGNEPFSRAALVFFSYWSNRPCRIGIRQLLVIGTS